MRAASDGCAPLQYGRLVLRCTHSLTNYMARQTLPRGRSRSTTLQMHTCCVHRKPQSTIHTKSSQPLGCLNLEPAHLICQPVRLPSHAMHAYAIAALQLVHLYTPLPLFQLSNPAAERLRFNITPSHINVASIRIAACISATSYATKPAR